MPLPYSWSRIGIYATCRLLCIVYSTIMALFHVVLGSLQQSREYLNLSYPYVTSVAFSIIVWLHLSNFISHICGIGCRSSPQGLLSRIPWYDKYLGRNGLYGRRGKYYDVRLVLRELLEIPAQSYQGLLMSQRIRDSRIPLVLASFLAFDCIGVLTMLRYMKQPLLRRSSVLLLDVIVDIIVGAAIQLSLIVPPIRQYLADPAVSKDLAWSTEAVSAVKHMMVTSPLDLLFSMLPLLSCHFMLRTIHQNWVDISTTSTDPSSRNHSTAIVPVPLKVASQKNPMSAQTHRVMTDLDKTVTVQAKRSLFDSSVTWFCLFWAISTLTFAIRATQVSSCDHPSKAFCQVPVYPWFAKSGECHCLYFRLNCKQLDQFQDLNSTATTKEVNRIFAEDFAESVEAFSVLNCPIEDLPRAMQNYGNLFAIYIENTHLKNISLRLHDMTQLMSIIISKSNFEQIPVSLQRPPPKIYTIDLNEAQIETVPHWTSKSWKNAKTIGLAMNRINKLPSGLFNSTKLTQLLLFGNQLTSISSEIQHAPNLKEVQLSGNKLQALPIEFEKLTSLKILTLEGNNIASFDALPWNSTFLRKWTTTTLDRYFTLTNNPICSLENMQDEQICTPLCSPYCDPIKLKTFGCSSVCNTSACGFDNGQCL